MPAALVLLLLAAVPRTHTQAGSPPATAGATTLRPPTIAAIALSIKSRAIQDSRCYLMNGGAVESFFISEDTPVGSVIGTLSVNGDPSDEDGNISLKLQEKDAAIGIAPGTKNITLLRALDREEKLGPSNVYVNVRCDRRRTTDPSFIIPVSVRVWDVNDNAPMWSGAPYRVRLSELTAVGARVLPALRASDADQPGPHATVRYSVLPGDNSEFFGFANELDSVLVVKKPLDYESLSNFTITIRAEDQGKPPLHNDTTLYVEVLDADDQNPKFTHDHYTAVLPANAEEGTILDTSPGPIEAHDQDVGINAPVYYSVTGDKRDLLHVDRDTGQVSATKKLIDDVDFPVTVVIKATQVDNADRYALATLTLSRRSGALHGGVRFARAHYRAAVPEDAPVSTVLATLYTDPPRGRDGNPLQFYVSDRSFLDKFAINSAGEVILRRALDYETQDSYHYQVMVTDGATNDTASLNITVLNVNDWEPRFRYPQYEFRVDSASPLIPSDPSFTAVPTIPANEALIPVGKVEVFDGDKGDRVTLTLRGSDAGVFRISESGELFLIAEALSRLNSTVLHAVATAVDSGAPPRQTSVPIIVHVSERLVNTPGSGVAGGAGMARGGVLAVFAAALALLALLVLALLAYIYRVNKRRRSKPSPTTTASKRPHTSESKRSPAASVVPSVPTTSAVVPLAAANSGSLLSVSAGASTILANSTSSLDLRGDTLPPSNGGSAGRSATIARQSQRFPARSKIAPAPPAPPAEDTPSGGVALMSDHVGARGGSRSGVAWPSATIPARVKKLSWDDAQTDNKGSGEGQAEGAVLDASNPTVADHMNLTVYF